MDIWQWIITTVLTILTILFAGLSLPYPSKKIGKKIKKGYSWTRGLYNIITDKFFIKGDVQESFVYFIEEFEYFVMSNYTPSFPHMYGELIGKSKFSKMEEKHIHKEIERVQASYFNIKNVQKLRRKRIFEQTIREFKELVTEISKMARNIKTIIKDKNILRSTINQEYVDRYKFSAREFNNFLRYFRSFLDKTYCYHEVEIKQYRLMQLLIPEEIEFLKEVRKVL